MKFSEHWLREFVDPALAAEPLAERLTMAGLEVETIEPVAPAFDRVVVGEVLAVEEHPNAERLSICRVSVGSGAPLTVVCGAPNVAAGMKAPVALPGAHLPALEVTRTRIRGIESEAMLCSARELGLSEDHSGLLALPCDAPVGADLRVALDLDDRLITLKLTPNRGDCLSLRGIAREVSILTGAAFRFPSAAPVAAAIDARRAIRLDAPQACARYCGRVLRDLDARAPSPRWLTERLMRCGLRPVSAIVDVTNFVMLEYGQPLHAFDNRKLEGDIVVRWAKAGERLRLLNGDDVTLAPDLLVIADRRGPVALGGVMGGEATEVTDATTEVFLESAWFAPTAIAGRARRLNLASEAAHRFERGVDFSIAREAIERASALILEICGGQAGPVVEALAELPKRAAIRLRTSRIKRILGTALAAEEIAALLARLKLEFARDGEEFLVVAPPHRFDLEIEEDLIEEIARLYGYENIPARVPQAPLVMLAAPEQRRTVADLKRILVEREYFEVINFSFVDSQWERDFCGNDAPVALANPLAAQMDAMRSSLAGGLIANLRYNLARKLERVRIFEVGRCFLRSADPEDPSDPARAVAGYFQPLRLGALACGPCTAEQWGVKPTRRVDFYDLRGDIEALLAPREPRFSPSPHPALHPGRAAAVSVDGMAIGWIGELHPRWVQKYELAQTPVLFELDVEALLAAPRRRFREISRFPPVIRDAAFEVDQAVPAGKLLEALGRARLPFVQEIRLFDHYRGPGLSAGSKSLAFRVVMQDTARTLTDAEADAVIAQLAEILAAGFGAKLRAK